MDSPKTVTHEIRPAGVTTVHEDGSKTYEEHPFEKVAREKEENSTKNQSQEEQPS